MNIYIWIALLAYLCFALASLGDKFILSRTVKHPLAYAFYIGLFSPTVFIFAPFGLMILPADQMILAFLGGMSFTYALVFFYRAINQSGASKAVTVIAGIEPIFVLTLAFFIADERLNSVQLLAFIMMLIGSVLISIEKIEGNRSVKSILNGLMAAFLFALAFALYKNVYNDTNFISGLVWSRLGITLGGLSFLLYRPWRRIIFDDAKTPKAHSGKFIFFGNFILGASGGFLQNLSISLGSVSIVSALSGIQLGFVFILSSVLTRYFPRIFKEDLSRSGVIQKITAIILIAGGLAMLNI